jgi:endonuclease/exonuclease/phosphatase (EEP) superfamily protein YafD
VIAALSALATLAVAVVTVASYSSDWRLALIANFRLHLALAASLALLVVAVVDQPAAPKLFLLVTAFGAALVNLVEILLRTPRSATAGGDSRLRVAFANVLKSNPDAGRLIEWVRRETPDVLVVAEAIGVWSSRLAVLTDKLPFVVRTRIGDVAVYSWHDFSGEPRQIFPNIGHAVAVEVQGITLVALHTAAPEDQAHSIACDELIDRVGRHVEQVKGPVVVVGDFNATPWSAPVIRLVRRTGLRFGPGARAGSFPAELGGRLWPTWICIPIDLVLAGHGAAVVSRKHGPRIGSDHWPVLAEIAYSRRLDPSDPHP